MRKVCLREGAAHSQSACHHVAASDVEMVDNMVQIGLLLARCFPYIFEMQQLWHLLGFVKEIFLLQYNA